MKKAAIIVSIVLIVVIVGALIAAAVFGYKSEDLGVFEEDMHFQLNTFKVLGNDFSFAVSMSKSYIDLNSDGTCIIRITPLPGLGNIIPAIIGGSAISYEGLEALAGQYLVPLFPGFTFDDIDGSFKLMEDSLGIKIVGFDESSPEYVSLRNKIENRQPITNFALPSKLAIEIKAKYKVVKLYGEDNKEYTAVHIGGYDESYAKEPFCIFTLNETEKGPEVRGRIEFLDMEMAALLVEEE